MWLVTTRMSTLILWIARLQAPLQQEVRDTKGLYSTGKEAAIT